MGFVILFKTNSTRPTKQTQTRESHAPNNKQSRRHDASSYLKPVTAPTDANTTAMIIISPRTIAQHIHLRVFRCDTLAACKCATPPLMCSADFATYSTNIMRKIEWAFGSKDIYRVGF